MSKQRKKHPEVVYREKRTRGIKRGLSVSSNFAEYIHLLRRWQGFSGKYHGIYFRGIKRWK